MIVIPKDYHIKEALENSQILCITQETALKENIRALRIGILNIMPQAETYEFSLLHPLGKSIMQIEPIWIRLKTHTYSSSDQDHLQSVYVPFEQAIRHKHLDGLIVTGAPVEEMPFEEVSYWEEIKRILKYARNNIASTLGMCWGGLAIARFLGIDKMPFERKVFGVFENRSLNRHHRITGDMDDIFLCPHSSHSGISDRILELERDKGVVNLLAYSEKAGYTIFESTDHRFIVHLGHPEYEPRRLVEEYQRDMKKERDDVDPPENLDFEKPVNRWRGHRSEFFSQWIKYIHETTTF
ncbi:MAG: homoserine O-succinyltransferase [Spirochaetales bacterium]|nr:homoserine O-succinyltransferase [Spirochaetales bacterium]